MHTHLDGVIFFQQPVVNRELEARNMFLHRVPSMSIIVIHVKWLKNIYILRIKKNNYTVIILMLVLSFFDQEFRVVILHFWKFWKLMLNREKRFQKYFSPDLWREKGRKRRRGQSTRCEFDHVCLRVTHALVCTYANIPCPIVMQDLR